MKQTTSKLLKKEIKGYARILKLLDINCTLLENGKQKSEMTYYFCSCDPDKLTPICEECANNCHKEHDKGEAHFGERICYCGLDNHSLTGRKDKVDFTSACMFAEIDRAAGNKFCYSDGTKKYCSFCKIVCSAPGERQESNEEYGCACEHSNHASHSNTMDILKKLGEDKSVLENISIQRFLNAIFDSEKMTNNLFSSIKNKFASFHSAIEDGSFQWEENLRYTNYFFSLKALEQIASSAHDCYYYTDNLRTLFNPGFCIEVLKMDELGDVDTIMEFKAKLINCMYFFSTRNCLSKYPILTLEDYENLSPVQRLMITNPIKEDTFLNQNYFKNKKESGSFNYIDEVNSWLDKLVTSLTKRVYALLPTICVILKTFRKMASINLFDEKQKARFCKAMENFLSKHNLNEGLTEDQREYSLKIFNYTISILFFFAFQYNDETFYFKMIERESNIPFFHGKNEVSRYTSKVALVISNIVVSQKMNSGKGKNSIERVLTKVLNLLSVSLNYPDNYIFGLKRMINDECEYLDEMLIPARSKEEEDFINFMLNETNSLTSSCFDFYFNRIDYTALNYNLVQSILSFFSKIGREDYSRDSFSEHDGLVDSSRTLQPAAVAKAPLTTIDTPHHILLNKSAFVFAVINVIRIEIPRSHSNNESPSLQPETKQQVFRFLRYFIESSPDNAIFFFNKKIINTLIEFIPSNFTEVFGCVFSCFAMMEVNNYEMLNVNSVLKLLEHLTLEIKGDSSKKNYIGKLIKVFDMMTNDFDALNKNVLSEVKGKIIALSKHFQIINKTIEFYLNVSSSTGEQKQMADTLSKFKKDVTKRVSSEENINKRKEYEGVLSQNKDKFESDVGLNLPDCTQLMVKYFKLLVDVFDNTGELDEQEFLSTFVSLDDIIQLLYNPYLPLKFRTQLIRYFRMIYIDISIDTSKIDSYKEQFIIEVDANSDTKTKAERKQEVYSFLANLTDTKNRPDKDDYTVIKNEILNVREIIQMASKIENVTESFHVLANYVENGVLLPMKVFYNKFLILLNNRNTEEQETKTGLLSIQFFEVTLLFLYMKVAIFDFIKTHYGAAVLEEVTTEPPKPVDETRVAINKQLNAEFKKSILAGKSKSSLFLTIEQIEEQTALLLEDIGRLENEKFDIFDYNNIIFIFDKHFDSIIERPKSESLMDFFSKKTDYVDEKKDRIMANLKGYKLSYNQGALLELIIDYEKAKQEIENSTFLEALSEQNYVIEKDYRTFTIELLHYIIRDPKYHEKFGRETLNLYLKLLQFNTCETQAEVLKDTVKPTALEEVNEAEKAEIVGIELEAKEVKKTTKAIKNLKSDGEDLVKLFQGKFCESLLNIIFYAYNPSSSSFNYDYFNATHMIKILKYLCEEHNIDFQTMMYTKIYLPREEGISCSFIDFCLFALHKLIILSQWEYIEFEDVSKDQEYYYDIFSSLIEFVVECIQGTTSNNLLLNFNDSSYFFDFLRATKKFLVSDKFHNELVYKVKVDIMNLIIAVITEKNVDSDIGNDMSVEMPVDGFLSSSINCLKKLYLQLNEENPNYADYKKCVLDQEIFNYYSAAYYKDEVLSEEPAFQLANKMFQYVKIMANTKFDIKDAKTALEVIKDNSEEDILEMYGDTPSSKQVRADVQVDKHMLRQVQSYYLVRLFNEIVKVVKINYDGEDIDVYYTVNPLCKLITTNTLRNFDNAVNRDSRFTKLFDLMQHCSFFYDEIAYNEAREKKWIVNKWLNKINYYSIMVTLYLLTVMINICIFLGYDTNNEDSFQNGAGTWYTVITILSVVQLCVNIIVVITWFYSKFLLYYMIESKIFCMANAISQNKLSIANKIKISVKTLNGDILGFMYIVFLNIFGLISPNYVFIYAFQLLACVNLTDLLRNILKAIILKIDQFLITIAFLIVFIYAYSMLGFLYINDEFVTDVGDAKENLCSSSLRCFASHLGLGLRSGGGIGDSLENKSYENKRLFFGRLAYDMIYFAVIIIIMLNILFGIIIDAFGELREKTVHKLNDLRNVCFICGALKDDMEKDGINFVEHWMYDHHYQSYIFYIVGLKFMDVQDLNAVDSYAYEKIENKDISWFPDYSGPDKEEGEEEEEEED